MPARSGHLAILLKRQRFALEGIHGYIPKTTTLRSRNSGVDAGSIGTDMRPLSRHGFIAGKANRGSHDRDHDDKTGQDRRGDTLCFVQGIAKSHDP